MANDRKPGFLGAERFPEDRGDIKNNPGDALLHAAGPADDNEGEGNKSADRRYREGVKHTIDSGQVEKKAKEAEKAVDGPEGQELRRAEEAAKKHSHGEDPRLKKTTH
jgi:hypothetical protein